MAVREDTFNFIKYIMTWCFPSLRQRWEKENMRYDDEEDQRAHHSCDLPVTKIVKGFKHFIHTQYKRYPEKFDRLKKTQTPKFLVFSCSDSRVSPSHILDFQLGEAFMSQNISALIPSSNKRRYSNVGTIIEYAVKDLKVENILVIGHSKCGGITRLMSKDKSVPFDFVDDWMNIALPAKVKVQADHGNLPLDQQIELCVQESVNLSLINLQTYSFVEKAIEEGKLTLIGGFYDFVAGSFKLWESNNSTISSPIIINCHN